MSLIVAAGLRTTLAAAGVVVLAVLAVGASWLRLRGRDAGDLGWVHPSRGDDPRAVAEVARMDEREPGGQP